MSMYNVVFYCCLCLICQMPGLNSVDRDLILCEGDKSLGLICSETQIIIIKDAIYGRTDLTFCLDQTDSSSFPSSCILTVTKHVASYCDYKRSCILDATNIDGGLCMGTHNYLNVTYRCIEDICVDEACSGVPKCTNNRERSICVCSRGLGDNDNDNICYDILPDTNRLISFKTAKKTSEVALLNLKKCMKEEGFLKFQFKSCDNVNITMVDTKENKVIEIIIDKAYNTLIYISVDGNVRKIRSNIGIRCNTFSTFTLNWIDGVLKFGTIFDNYLKFLFKIPFRIHDINLSSALEADWIVNFYEPVSDATNYVNAQILPNNASILLCQVFQTCNEQIPIFAKTNYKCRQKLEIETKCTNKGDGATLSYSCTDQTRLTDEGCKDILRISACKGVSTKCDRCKYFNTRLDINRSCVRNTVLLLEFFDKDCENLHDQLTIWHEIYDQQLSLEFSSQLSTQFFTTTTSLRSSSLATEQQLTYSTTDNILTKSYMSNQETRRSEIIGLAVGISCSVIVIIVIACVLIFLRKKKRSPKKESTQTSSNAQDYIGNQNIAMPCPGDSPEYTDMKVHRESHKYGVLKSVNETTGDSCYDVIDVNEHQWKTKVVSVDQGIFQKDSSSIPCQEYAILDPNEKWNTKPNTSPYRDTGCDDYTVLEAEEVNDNHPVYHPSDQLDISPKTNQTKNNETKMEVTSARSTTLKNYTVLDPKLTGFNRMNDTGNDRCDPSLGDMVHDTTHPLKEDMKYYELAKPLDEDGKENACHEYGGDYGLCQDSDYNKPNAGHPTYSEEHVYNHTVDDVYDTTSHNKKCTTLDNTYDYFSGDKTDDDYNIPKKL